jgi:hypothetical protein
MARQNRNATRAGQRARVQTAEGGSFGLSVVAPNGGAVVDPSAQAASQLMEALGVGKELAQAHQANRQAQGAEDAVAGDVDEELRERSEFYRAGVVKVQAEAGFIHASREMQAELDALDLTSVEPDQLPTFINRAIDKVAMDQYGGLQDRAEAEIVAPLLKKFREEYVGRIVEQQKAVADGEQQANIRTIAGVMAAGPVFDHNAINERVTAIYGKNMRSQELSFEIIADIAIREGRPELLTGMPDKWGSGASTAKILPEFAAKYRSAVNQAEANASALATERARQQNAANKEALRLAELEAARTILVDTRDPASAIAKIMALPGADAASVFAIQGAWRSARDDVEERAANPAASNQLWADIYTGTASISTVLAHFGMGTLGRGPSAVQEAQSMYAAVNQISNSAKSGNSRAITEFQQNLSERYNPKINGELGPLDAGRATIRIEAMAEFNQRVLIGGEDPVKVHTEVVEKYDVALDKSGINPAPMGSVSTQARNSGLHADRAIRAFASGKASAADLIAYGATPERIEQLHLMNRISAEEANAALGAYTIQ